MDIALLTLLAAILASIVIDGIKTGKTNKQLSVDQNKDHTALSEQHKNILTEAEKIEARLGTRLNAQDHILQSLNESRLRQEGERQAVREKGVETGQIVEGIQTMAAIISSLQQENLRLQGRVESLLTELQEKEDLLWEKETRLEEIENRLRATRKGRDEEEWER